MGTFGLAVELFFFPDSLVYGSFHRLIDFMDPETVCAYSFVVSLSGMVALAFNGLSPITGPMVRSVTAIGRGWLWSQFSYALYLLDPISGPPSPPPSLCFVSYHPLPSIGLGFWIFFTLSELYVAYRAMTDVQRAL